MTARDVIAEMREDAAKLRDSGEVVAGSALFAYADRLESTLAQPSGEAVEGYEAQKARWLRAYEAGWCNAAKWADRDDLVADIGSKAYALDRATALDADQGAHPFPATPPAPLGGLTEGEELALSLLEKYASKQSPAVRTVMALARRLTAPRAEEVDLLEVARRTGLRQMLHGVNATDARAALAAFVAALTAAAPKVAAPQAEAGEVEAALSVIVSASAHLATADEEGTAAEVLDAVATIRRALAQPAAQGGDGVADAVVAEMSQMVREYATYPEAYQWMREVVAWRNKLAALAPQRSENGNG